MHTEKLTTAGNDKTKERLPFTNTKHDDDVNNSDNEVNCLWFSF